MPKKIKNKSENNVSVYVFITSVIGLFFLTAFIVIYSFFHQGDIPKELLKQEVEKLADGKKIPYGDPLVFDEKARYPKVESDDPTQGNKLAPATVFLFSDFTCQPCKKQQEIIKDLIKNYSPEQLRVVWKGVAIKPKGILAQTAAYCAQNQGKFWQFADKLFTLSENEFTMQKYETIAQDLGLDVDKFNSCMVSPLAEDKVIDNNALAGDLEIKYLPYFYIDNTPYKGVLSFKQLQGIINLLINY